MLYTGILKYIIAVFTQALFVAKYIFVHGLDESCTASVKDSRIKYTKNKP